MTYLPELLVPAADQDKLDTALTYGADAVYLGGQALNLRAKAGGFSFAALPTAVAQAHAAGARVYFTLNILAQEHHLPEVERYLEQLGASGVDGIIIADPGIVGLALHRTPQVPVHLSTQANTSNSLAARFWRDLGVRRVNVARELDATRIRAMAIAAPGLELEVFVHGAMCMAISGHCLLSAHLNRRSGNLGQCSHPCRFDYKVTGLRLEERLRPGDDMWELHSDDEFTQIMAAQDLCLIKYLRWFQRQGVHSLKIEGRMKTTSYLAQVTDIYRTALDDLAAGTFRPTLYLDELQHLATRPLCTGFFTRESRILRPALPRLQTRNIVGRLSEPLRDGQWLMDVKHRFQAGDSLEIVLPGLRRPLLQSDDYGIAKDDYRILDMIHSGQRVVLHCEHPELRPGLFLRAHQPDSSMS